MGRPKSKSGLNSTTERELVYWVAKGLGPEEAAKRAGLPSSARLYDYRRTNAFADDLRQALRDNLTTEHAPKAIKILAEIMEDDRMPARVRVDAAKTLLDRSGYTAATVAADAAFDEDSPMYTWTIPQLEAFLAKSQRALARAEATDAEIIEVVSPVVDGDALDCLLQEGQGRPSAS